MLHTIDYKHFAVILSNGQTLATFEGAVLAKTALPGDTVEYKNGQVLSVTKRVKHPNLVGTLELASKFRFGMTSRNVPIFRFTPFNESYPPFFVGSSQKDLSTNMLAVIEFSNWDSGTCPRGNLVQTIGPCGDLAAEEKAILLNACLTTWKKGEAETLQVPALCPGMHTTVGTTFHIDPPGCKDIDDAITLRRIDDTIVEVKIHITDVASWLLTNPTLYIKAADIGQTYYLDGAAMKPMFPPHLSEGLFSLLPGQERCAWTLTFLWDTEARAAPTNFTWSLERIVVSESYTYITAYTSPHAALLRDITSTLAGRDLTDSHEWVEQLMLLYNREVARILKADGNGVLRRHAGKDVARYEAYAALGLPADRLAMLGGEYCLPTEADSKHWALGVDAYCHASSPIRRWADCMNQVALRESVLTKTDYSLVAEYSLVRPTEERVAALNEKSKRAKAYERDVHFARILLGVQQRTGIEAIVAEVSDTKTKLWVPKWNRMISSKQVGAALGDRVTLSFFADPKQRSWKRRVVVEFQQQTLSTPV